MADANTRNERDAFAHIYTCGENDLATTILTGPEQIASWLSFWPALIWRRSNDEHGGVLLGRTGEEHGPCVVEPWR